MFDIGFWELVLCFVVALLVLGPERLPGVARTLGSWVGRARATVHQVSEEWGQEVDTTHWREEARRLREEMEQVKRRTADEMRMDDSDSGDRDSDSARATPDSSVDDEQEQ